MTHTAIRPTLSALAAFALVFALASSAPASAQDSQINNMMNNNLMFNRGKPKGLATKGSQQPTAQPKGLSAQKPSTNPPRPQMQRFLDPPPTNP
jgi:hypothetical protein